MIFEYHSLEHEKEVPYKKHDICCTLLKPNDFDDYIKEMDGQNQHVSVVGTTCFHISKEKPDKKNRKDRLKVLNHDGKEVLVDVHSKRRRMYICGYLPVSNTEFVLVESWLPLLFLFLLLGMLIVFLFWLGMHRAPNEGPKIPDDSTYDWAGGNDEGDSQAVTDNTVIPGFTKITAENGHSNMQLYNPAKNTVKFVYLITEILSEEVVASFDTAGEAEAYIAKHKKEYQPDYGHAGDYRVVDEDGEVSGMLTDYKAITEGGMPAVTKTTSRVVYFTKGIAPGKAIDWDVKDSLPYGEHNLRFHVLTYDMDTNVPCYGAILDVKAVIQ